MFTAVVKNPTHDLIKHQSTMFRALAIISAFVGAAAFAPARMARSAGSALKMSFESEIGAQVGVLSSYHTSY